MSDVPTSTKPVTETMAFHIEEVAGRTLMMLWFIFASWGQVNNILAILTSSAAGYMVVLEFTKALLMVIFGGLRFNAPAIPMLVGLYITAASWFTASTSFANPAVTLARAFSNTFAGIAPACVLPFIVAQLAGLGLALLLVPHLFAADGKAQS